MHRKCNKRQLTNQAHTEFRITFTISCCWERSTSCTNHCL